MAASIAATAPTTKMGPPSNTPVASKGRKRKVAEAAIDDDQTQERARGRPRKNSKDESAAERRRTQIRLAQRAYRQRKESTIDELRQQVAELTSTMEIMNKSLKDFANIAMRRGLQHETKVDLNALLRKLTNASGTAARKSTKKGSLDAGDVLHNISAVTRDLSDPSVSDRSLDGEHEQTPPQIGMGYVMMDSPPEDSVTTPPDEPDDPYVKLAQHCPSAIYVNGDEVGKRVPSEEKPWNDAQRNNDLAAVTDPFMETSAYGYSLVPRTRTLSTIETHNYFEPTFARRLHRNCTEQAYQLLKMPHLAPQTLRRVFTLQFNTGRDTKAIMAALKHVTERDMRAPLDTEAPFANIGGAGLHYPDSGATRRVSTVTSVAMDIMASRIPGLQGEWLDPADVNGYLQERGIDIEPGQDYVYATLPISSLVAPPEEMEMDKFIATLPSEARLHDAEAFHNRFMQNWISETPEDVIAANNNPKFAAWRSKLGKWNGTTTMDTPPEPGHSTEGLAAATTVDFDMNSVSELMDAPVFNMFSVPGTLGYDVAVPRNKTATTTTSASKQQQQQLQVPQDAVQDPITGVILSDADFYSFAPFSPADSNGQKTTSSLSSGGDSLSPPASMSSSGSGVNGNSNGNGYGNDAFTSAIGGGSGGMDEAGVEDISRPNLGQTMGQGSSGSDSDPMINVTLDVVKLMKVLMLPSLCLGRTPGFRRKVVDMAVRNSVIMSF